MKKVFVIDNYDSFTYNLVQYLTELNCKVLVKRNDQFKLNEIENFEYLLLSPGPGIPEESGLLKKTIKFYAKTKNILGVCLGQQAICEVFGGQLVNLKRVYHGVSSKIKIIEKDSIFNNLPESFNVGRYHSWVVKKPLPESLIATSIDKNGEIMSLKHKEFKVRGVQFHPESILTPNGKKILENWLIS